MCYNLQNSSCYAHIFYKLFNLGKGRYKICLEKIMCSIYSISLKLLSVKTYLCSLINGYEKVWIMVKMLTLQALTLSTEIMEHHGFLLIPAVNTCSSTLWYSVGPFTSISFFSILWLFFQHYALYILPFWTHCDDLWRIRTMQI